MSSLFGILDISERGLTAASLGLRTTGHNIANVNTPGYSRQRQVTQATRPIPNTFGHLGTGVEQLTIERVTDANIQRQLQTQGSFLGASDAQAQALSAIEGVLNEQDGPGLSAALVQLYDSFDDLAAASNSGAPTERAAVRSTAEGLIATLQQLDRQLRDQQSAADTAIQAAVPEINRLVAQINDLNEQIAALEVQAPANDLRDQLDLKLRELAEFVDINTFSDGPRRIVVTLGNGLPLVEGGTARRLEVFPDAGNPFDPTFAQIHYRDGASDVDVSAEIGAGRLGGLLRVRDSLIPGAIRSLDTVAYNLVTGVNAIHNLGTGLNGANGDFFAALPGVEDAARDIALDPAIVASTDGIAAGLSSAPSDNRNALALADLRDAAGALFLPGDPPGPASGPTRSLLEHAAAVVSDIGQQSATLQTSRDQQSRILANLETRRDEVSGVSLDEEMTRLVELQAAFQANARVVSMIDRLLGDIIEMI